jgi:hypothetical protein
MVLEDLDHPERAGIRSSAPTFFRENRCSPTADSHGNEPHDLDRPELTRRSRISTAVNFLAQVALGRSS